MLNENFLQYGAVFVSFLLYFLDCQLMLSKRTTTNVTTSNHCHTYIHIQTKQAQKTNTKRTQNAQNLNFESVIRA